MFLTTGLIKVTGTKTFRSSMEAIFKRTMFVCGRNFQNIEKSQRQNLVAPRGYKIIQADQKGAEAKVVAYECPYGNMRKLFEVGIKPHTFVALRNFHVQLAKRIPDLWDEFHHAASVEIDELIKLPYWKQLNSIIEDSDNWESSQRWYFLGKCQCHSGNYLIGWNTYRDTVIKRSEGKIWLKEDQCKQDLFNYRNVIFKELLLWHKRVLDTIHMDGQLRNLFGHPFKFTSAVDDTNQTDAIAFVPQSTVGVITHKAFIKLSHHIRDNKLAWHPFNNNHDSYAAFVPDDEVLEGKARMQEFMEQHLTSTLGEQYQMKASIAVGDNWAPWHKEKNPNGLVESR